MTPSSARALVPRVLALLAAVVLLIGSVYVVQTSQSAGGDSEASGATLLAWPALVLLAALLGSLALWSDGRGAVLGWWLLVCLAGGLGALVVSPALGPSLPGNVLGVGGLEAGDLVLLGGGWWLIVRRGPTPW
jgi:hypothetical protein